MRRVLALTLLTLTRCGDGTTAPLPDEPGPPTPLVGAWSYEEHISNTQRRVACGNVGTLTIAQDSADLTGAVARHLSCLTTDGSGIGFEDHDTTTLAGNVGAATVRFNFGGCAYRGALYNTPRDSAAGTVDCTLSGARLGTLQYSGSWYAIRGVEERPPTANGVIIPAAVGDAWFVTGETIRFTRSAIDDRKLHKVGYHIWPPMNLADSLVTPPAPTYTDTLQFVAQAGWDGASDVMVWAEDAAGSRNYNSIGTLHVVDGIRRPFQSRAFAAHVTDIAYDAARGLVYLAQPDSARVGVLALGTMTLGTPLAVPISPAAAPLDIVPGGDTVVAVVRDSAALALLDRVAGARTTVPISGASAVSGVVVASNRHALVLGGADSAGFFFYGIWDHDLATGTDTLRRDIGLNGHVGAVTQLFRSPDHSKVLVYTNSPACGYIYDAATGTFSGCLSGGLPSPGIATATTSGSRWLWNNLLLDDSLRVIATIPAITSDYIAGLAPDGAAAYVPTWYGYDKLALPSGTVLERVRVPWPFPLTRITVFPEGTRLLLWSDLVAPMTGMLRAIVVDLR